MVFCNSKKNIGDKDVYKVTILILIDGFLQYHFKKLTVAEKKGHNPYFNRWFSAIERRELNNIRKGCHNPYFNRWFSAI